MPELSVHDYRTLIRDALPSTPDADTETPSFHGLYTPDTHRRALQPDVTIVRGARGVGKTYWYKSMQDDTLRRLAADAYQIPALDQLRTIQGYGTALSPANYPSSSTMRHLLAHEFVPHDVWMAVLLHGLGVGQVTARANWAERTQWVRESPEEVDAALHEVDERAGSDGTPVLVLFDALDQLHGDRSRNDLLARGILELALQLRLSTRHIRAKVFIRPDMLDSLTPNLTDSSKLVANAADLTWSNTNLFGLAFHSLGNSTGTHAAAFRAQAGSHWRDVGTGQRFTPPQEVTADRDTQQLIFTGIAGQYMGTNHRKGHTYSWLPNHLMDGMEQVSPRSFLSALSTAAERTASTYSGYEFPLHFEAIRAGVQHASRIRAGEIKENIPWAAALIESLDGLQVPVQRSSVEERWAQQRIIDSLRPSGLPDGDDDNIMTGPRSFAPEDLITELVELGVMSRRRDGRLDLPDVYRIAFNIGRKGGVPRLSR